MQKFLLLMILSIFSTLSFADPAQQQEVSISVSNTSDLSDSEAAAQLFSLLKDDPNLQGSLLHLTVGSAEIEGDLSLRIEPMGPKAEIKVSQWSRDVGNVVSSATGGSAGGSVKITVTHEDKRPDGSGTKTSVEIVITASGKKGGK